MVSPSLRSPEASGDEASDDEVEVASGGDEAFSNEVEEASGDESSYSLPSEPSERTTPMTSYDQPQHSTDSQNFHKIFSGSDILICAFNCAIMRFAIKHNLTFKAIDDLLQLFSFVLLKPNLIPVSIYKLKRFFSQYTDESLNQRFCTKCQQIKDCDCDKTTTGHLVSVPVEKPLQSILIIILLQCVC